MALISGGLAVVIFYGGAGIIRDMTSLKKGIPKNKPATSEYVKENPERFESTNPGFVSEKDKREVERDERRRAAKFREFEKLRQVEFKRRTGIIEKPKLDSKRTSKLPGNPVLSNVPNSRNKGDGKPDSKSKRIVKLDD